MQPASAPMHTTARVMVVEDDVLIRLALAEELREAGFIVVESATADEAWSYFSAGIQPDLLVSDIQMPGTMDGLELARRIRQQHPHLPIILVSAKVTQAETYQLGRLVTKPYSIPHLVALAAETLGLPPSKQSQ